MIVSILVEKFEDGVCLGRDFVEAEGEPTEIPVLALVMFRSGYSVTHIPTGRSVNDGPLRRSEALDLIRELAEANLPWWRVVDGDNSGRLDFNQPRSGSYSR